MLPDRRLDNFSQGGKEMLKTHSWRTAGPVMALTAIVGLALPALGDEMRPFRGHVDEVIIDVTPVPEGLLVTATGKGQATHLGRFTRLGRVVVHPEDGSAEGTVVFTAANGDQLVMDVVGLPTTTASISGTYTFAGGTGRFRNASGGADFVGLIAADGIHITVAFEGTIQY
jgi:hypothetical protein